MDNTPPVPPIHDYSIDETPLPIQRDVHIESSIDRLTLQYFTNKKTYRKYLSSQDASFAQEWKTYEKNRQKYRNSILQLFTRYLDNTHLQITTDLDEGAQHFMKSCIRYLDMQEMEKKTHGGCYETYQEDDDDILFPEEPLTEMGEEDFEADNAEEVVERSGRSMGSSYWGKSIEKIDTTATSHAPRRNPVYPGCHDMNLFVKRKSR